MGWVEIFVGVLIAVISDELLQWSPRLAQWIVKKSATLVPPDMHERFLEEMEEWSPKLENIPGRLSRIIFAIGTLRAALTLHLEYRGSVSHFSERKETPDPEPFSHRLIAAQEAERTALASKLEGPIADAVCALQFDLYRFQAENYTIEHSQQLEDDIKRIIMQVCELCDELRPRILTDLGLIETLQYYGEKWARETGIRTDVVIDFDSARSTEMHLAPSLETACFRIVEEALTNVVQHSQAHLVLIKVQQEYGSLHLLVRDNGIGFDAEKALEQARKGNTTGLLMMQERVQMCSGNLQILSEPQLGTEIRISFPLSESETLR